MRPTAAAVLAELESWAPAGLAESWDNVGLQVGDPGREVGKVLVALDPAAGALEAADRRGADLVVTHHPLLFEPLASVDLSRPVPSLVAGFLRAGICLVALHTNLDAVPGGVSDQLACALGLTEVRPLVPAASGPPGSGLGRIGRLPEAETLGDVLGRLAGALDAPWLRVVGEEGRLVRIAALCGGAGSSLWPEVLAAGADLFVTGEIKHSVAREAEAAGVALVDAGHFRTERPVVRVVRDFLRRRAGALGWEVVVEAFEDEPDPFRLWTSAR
ncbi:Nif3-like dinuclear metal center hexameric protein [Dissulfurirhabdus thermomarina]|nr:Nif3-like dinuclear metal center hexameric protein [Dissulfurirhabdus thermomarina]